MSIGRDLMAAYTPEVKGNHRGMNSGSGAYPQIPKETQITHNGEFIGTLETIGSDVRCDCPISNPSHSDGCGMDYAHTVTLDGGDIGIHCGGDQCACTYIPEVEARAAVEYSFDAIDVAPAPIVSMSPVDNIFNASVWHDIITDSFFIRKHNCIRVVKRASLRQHVANALFYTNDRGKTSEYIDQIPSFMSAYKPDMGLDDFRGIDGELWKNTYVPSVIMSSDKRSTTMPPNIYKMIVSLFNGDEELMYHFVNWLAYIIQYRKKTGMAWVFVGVPGTGKGLINDVMKIILAEHSRGNLTDRNLNADFNPFLQGTLLCVFNEVSVETKKDRMAVKNKLKTWVTDSTVDLNMKGIGEYETESYSNFLIFSNEFIPVDIEENDRRYNVVNTGEPLNTLEWWDTERSATDITNEASAFADYLRGINVNVSDRNRIIINDKRSSLIEATKELSHKIADAIKDKNWDFFEDAGVVDIMGSDDIENAVKDGEITMTQLSSIVRDVYEKEMSKTWITQHIINKHELYSRRIKRGGTRETIIFASNVPF